MISREKLKLRDRPRVWLLFSKANFVPIFQIMQEWSKGEAKGRTWIKSRAKVEESEEELKKERGKAKQNWRIELVEVEGGHKGSYDPIVPRQT